MLCKIKSIPRGAVAILLALSGCAALPMGRPATYERVVAQFEATVTSAEFVHHGPSTIVRKWTGPVRFAVINADPFQAAIVRYNMEVLAKLTGLQVDLVRTIKQSNFRIVFGTRGELRKFLAATVGDDPSVRVLARSPCFANLQITDGGVIQYAQAGIGKENRGELMRHCMLEELVQAFGPANDACKFRPSLFCDGPGTHGTGLTDGDKIIMKTLYDPRLKPGMSREQTMPIARKIIAELFAGGSGT